MAHGCALSRRRHSPQTRTSSFRGLFSHAWRTRLFVGFARFVGRRLQTCWALLSHLRLLVCKGLREAAANGQYSVVTASEGVPMLVSLSSLWTAHFSQQVRETVVWEVALHFIPF